MNKNVIKKYKREFDHYLNEGSLLWCRSRDQIKVWTVAKDSHIDFFNTNDSYYIYIINDEYVEFRKALAEGKTILYNPITQYNNRWDIIKSICPSKTDSIKNYRIKPEESKFKVGAWVRDIITNKIHQVKNEDICNGKYSQVIKWNPQPGEWCWVSTNGTYSLYQYNSTSRSTHDLEPFIGTLPTHLKD